MTSEPSGIAIRSFEDVLANEDLRVIVVTGSFQAAMLGNSEEGSAKYEVYRSKVRDDPEAWFPTTKTALQTVLSQPESLLYFHDRELPVMMSAKFSDF